VGQNIYRAKKKQTRVKMNKREGYEPPCKRTVGSGNKGIGIRRVNNTPGKSERKGKKGVGSKRVRRRVWK